MPRILPRLLDKIARQGQVKKEKVNAFDVRAFRYPRKSIHKPVPPRPSFHPSDHPQSILLAPANPVTNSQDYVQHKSFPPRLRVSKRVRVRPNEYDRPREMSDEERSWWASPYLRMLSSPIRKCIATTRFLPSDFLIRLAPMRLPPSRRVRDPRKLNITQTSIIRTTLIPDGLEHSKFTTRKSGKAAYVLCWKDAVKQIAERGGHRRVAYNMTVHSLLSQQIAHLLRVRVLQELELLADELEARPQRSTDSPIIRRLTREEWKGIKTTGIIPFESAVAVLVVPPLNRDPVTKQRPEGSLSTLPLDDELPTLTREGSPKSYKSPSVSSHAQLPLSVLHLTTPMSTPSNSLTLPDAIPDSQAPLYNGLTVFPSRPQRAALHACLNRLLFIERRARYREHFSDADDDRDGNNDRNTIEEPRRDRWARGEQKASHAFLLCCNAETGKRADVAAVAIALWRVRMFEGGGWENDSGWVLSESL